MKLKTLIVSVVVLAVLSGVVYFLQRPSAPLSTDSRIGQALVDPATLERAAKFRITDQGKTVVVAKQADGSWRVPSYHDLPADFQKLSSLVGSLSDAKLQRLVATKPDRLARLEFKDTKIELLDSADKVLLAVTLGKNAETGGGRYVRFGDEQKGYLANLNAWLDVEAKNWANTELLALKADDIAKIEVPFAEGGPVTFSRAKKEDPWTSDKTPAGQRVKGDKVSQLLSSLGTIRFTETTPADDPGVAVAKANQRAIKLTTFDNKTVTVALGRKPEEKKLKPPTAAPLPSVTELTKKDDAAKAGEAKPLAPEYETIPAGPVFASISHSDASAPVNALMQKRAFQIQDYAFTSLPQKAEELFEPAPAAAPAPAPAPAEARKQ
jgi:hypothetical protein